MINYIIGEAVLIAIILAFKYIKNNGSCYSEGGCSQKCGNCLKNK